MKHHEVTVSKNIFTPTHSDDFRLAYSVVAKSPHGNGYGNTEDESLVDFAKRQGVRLWNEENLAQCCQKCGEDLQTNRPNPDGICGLCADVNVNL